ncbi:P-loop containing nucleoside triphosphate hydrolase protein [Crassisporium funariophilum]|nr:P-loop containing nucleoside triphosphate hydrolase protein [Crassisporium funariophilum]
MMSRPTLLAQSILDGNDPALNRPIPTFTIQESEIVNSDIQAVFDHHRPIGISPGYSAAGKLISLAIADDKNCRIIEFVQAKQDLGRGGKTSAPASTQGSIDGRHLLQDQILCRSVGDVFAFDMGPLSMSLHCDLAVRITNAVDIQSAFSAIDRKPLTAIMDALGDTVKVSPENVKHVFSNPIYDKEDRNRATDLAQRAWVSQFLVGYQNGAEIFEKVPRIDTKKLDPHRLDMISKIANDALRLDQKKPNQVKHDFNQSLDSANDQVRLSSTSFKNRLRSEQNVRMKVTGPQGAYFTSGAMADISGKSGNVISGRKLTDKTLTAVISIGRDDPTTAEAQRAATVLRILQGAKELLNSSPWIQNIWFPSSDDGSLSWPEEWSTQPQSPLRTPRLNAQHQSQSQSQPPSTALQHTLNPSQQAGVNYMLSDLDNHRITLVQGPPGTGKTSVIAAYVQFAIRRGQGGIWLVAQSNVAVKNIAEKLLAVGFLDWKLLVSKDFHFEWHEHIYHKVENNIIRSDSFFSGASKSNLRGCQVILCTISMLSNKLISKFTMEIPIRTLIVDEASQIEVGNYVSIFTTFQNTLRKACFIGDDKQLPPFGQEDLQDLQSIFEIPHLKKHVVFLDTQCNYLPCFLLFCSEILFSQTVCLLRLEESYQN